MFSPKTFDFLIENRMRNNKEWFLENKEIYNREVLAPLTELAEELATLIASMDMQIVTTPKINKVISRIYRDTRFSKDKSVFRESMWLSYKRDKKEFPHYPEFFIVMTPEQFLYGCGYYAATPEAMKCMRNMVTEDDPMFRKALKAYKNQSVFTLEGDAFKRSKYPDFSKEKRNWLDRKNICFTRYSTDFDLLFSDKLSSKLGEDLLLMKPVYDFLIQAENKASGKIK